MWRVMMVIMAAAILGACGAARMPPAQTLTPTKLSSETQPITFTRMVVRVPAGAEVGNHHRGLLKVKRNTYTWGSGITVASDEFKIIASETMLEYGLTVLGGDNLLFGQDESSKATYQLGGTLTNLRYNTYGGLAGDYADAWVEIEWQLYHAMREAVLFTATTRGIARHEDWESGVQAVKEAFRVALKNLIADRAFVGILMRDVDLARAEGSPDLVTLQACLEPAATVLPEQVEDAFAAVPVIRVGATLGSGVVISPDGYLLTAAHVVSGVSKATVRFRSGLELVAEVVSLDPAQDVALLRLPGSGHACLRLAGADAAPIGTDLFTIGSPRAEDLAFSVTKGVVSGHRLLEGFSYLQTDASLNAGNSGGPMLNERAEIIGVVSFKLVGMGVEGIAFGVPPAAFTERLALSIPN